MRLILDRIGLIEQADVNVNGLTVIAGENDTGKSTVGKVLVAAIKADMISLIKHKRGQSQNLAQNRKTTFDKQIYLYFENHISSEGSIRIISDEYEIDIAIKQHRTQHFDMEGHHDAFREFQDAIFIQTPFVWDLIKTFRSISVFKDETELLGITTKIAFPYFMWDLYLKLMAEPHDQPSNDYQSVQEMLKEAIAGEFKKDERGTFAFYKHHEKIMLSNVATGIRQFGILQVLLQNGQLNANRLLIFDEPEVHLHPKWQLKMAQIIVELVKSGMKVIVNSHSPYMIEALQRFGEAKGVVCDFYLADKGNILKHDDSNAQTLSHIFEKLSEPFGVFDQMDADSLEGLAHG